MFTVGLEFEAALLKRSLRQAAAVSLTGILAPFALGVGAGVLLHQAGGFFSESMSAPQAGVVPRRVAVDHRLPGAWRGSSTSAA